MILVGLTGSIGMGKSETAAMFVEENIAVYDADAAVHALYAPGGLAVDLLEEAFPGVVKHGAVDRGELSKHVVGDAEALKRLEAIVHPLVGQSQMDFLLEADARGDQLVVLDIPLLFETGGDRRVDFIVVVSAPADVQRTRVLDRPEMTPEKFDIILAKQTPDAEKCARADFIIKTDQGLEPARQRVREIIAALANKEGKIWDTRKPAP